MDGDARLRDVKSVPASERPLDMVSFRTEVSPLSRLIPDTRCGLIFAGLIISCVFFLTGSSNGIGGTGMFGACPDCWLHRLVDLSIRGTCRFRSGMSPVNALSDSFMSYPRDDVPRTPWEKLRGCP